MSCWLDREREYNTLVEAASLITTSSDTSAIQSEETDDNFHDDRRRATSLLINTIHYYAIEKPIITKTIQKQCRVSILNSKSGRKIHTALAATLMILLVQAVR